MSETWREKAIPLIEESIRVANDLGIKGKDLVRFLDREFPWGPRINHPYRIWQQEVRRRLGLRYGTIRRRVAPGQGTLFPTGDEHERD